MTIERIHRTLKGKLPKLSWQEEWERAQMYRDGMWAMFRKEGSDHAGLTWMIEALSRLVSGLPMWVESIRRGEFFTSGKG